jgi:hypothetical protein
MILECKNCNRTTIARVAELADSSTTAESCYAAIDCKSKRWVKGCAYKKAKDINKKFADRLIGTISSISPLSTLKKKSDSGVDAVEDMSEKKKLEELMK